MFVTSVLILTLIVLLLIWWFITFRVNSDLYIADSASVSVLESPHDIQVVAHNQEPTNCALVYIHGGSFFTGKAKASVSIAKQWARATNLKVYLLKYPTNCSAEKTLIYMLSQLMQMAERDLFLIGSSAGTFWAMYIALYIKSPIFKARITDNAVAVDKQILGIVSLCGIIDINYKHKVGWLFFKVGPFVRSIIGPALNPYDYITDLDQVRLLLIDTRNGLLNFADQVIAIQSDRLSRGIVTETYIFQNLPHNFVYNWKYQEAKQAFNMIIFFINKYKSADAALAQPVTEPDFKQALFTRWCEQGLQHPDLDCSEVERSRHLDL